MREAAALGMTDADVLAALCGSLLRCQQWRLARKVLGGPASPPLPASAGEALVLGRARELLTSAAGLGSLEVTQVCLMVLRLNESIASVRGAVVQGATTILVASCYSVEADTWFQGALYWCRL